MDGVDCFLSVNPTNQVSLNRTLRYDAVDAKGTQGFKSGTKRPPAYRTPDPRQV
jgi:hypothetical protein